MITHNSASVASRTRSSDRGYAQVLSAVHLAGLAHLVGRLRVTNITRFHKWGDHTVLKACLILAAAMHPGMRRHANFDRTLTSRTRAIDSRIAVESPSVARTQAELVRGASFRHYYALVSATTLRLRPRKTLCTCVLATAVLTAPAHIDASEGYELASLVVSIATAHAARATTEDVQLVWAMKNGLRRATSLFGRLSPRDDPRNTVTMTSGIRN